MSQHHLRNRALFWPILGALFLLAGLALVSIPGYILFHSLAEIFAIVISSAVFTLTWNTRRFLKNDYLLFVGTALLAASVLNSLHTLSYKGMGVFGTVSVTVEDDGQGFDVQEALARVRLGLLGMRERAEMLGGELEIESKPGAGTTVNVQVPARQPA